MQYYTFTCVDEDIKFPELNSSQIYDTHSIHIFNAECQYNIIFGRDMCQLLKLVIDFDNNIIHTDSFPFPMKPFPLTAHLAELLYIEWIEHNLIPDATNNIFFSDNDNDNHLGSSYYLKKITSSNYSKTDINTIINNCNHLTPNQQNQLKKLLQKYNKLFDRKLKI